MEIEIWDLWTWTHNMGNTYSPVTAKKREQATDPFMRETARKVAPWLTSGFTYVRVEKFDGKSMFIPYVHTTGTNECTRLRTGAKVKSEKQHQP